MLSAVPDAAALSDPPRHAAFVRVTHWITALCFFALLITGAEIVISHPRFYWGETGNDLTRPLFKIPIPASRRLVPTGYNYLLPDANGWSRYLHFQAAWLVVLTGLLYAIWGLWTGHFRSNLFPAPGDRSWQAFWKVIAKHIRLQHPDQAEAFSYNAVQRATYLIVIFFLFPLVIVTGLALSPGFNAAFPIVVNSLGGRQSARTLHFFITISLLIFLIIHVAMIILAGFMSRMRAMVTGRMITGTTIKETMITGTTTTGTTFTAATIPAAVPPHQTAEELP
jgi:thiosulfate reductase cytochrome b subunit